MADETKDRKLDLKSDVLEPLLDMARFVPSQVDSQSETTALPYTSPPRQLVWSDIKLFCTNFRYLTGIVWPLQPMGSGPLDELYPSVANLWCLFLHIILIAVQLIFILSIPAWFLFPFAVVAAWAAIVFAFGWIVSYVLNGRAAFLHSKVDISDFPEHPNEQWIFINGVAVGHHWMQSNLDRIALTFGRPVLGVLNPTSGIIFDTIQCLIQRDFSYATDDVRNGYAAVKKALLQAHEHSELNKTDGKANDQKVILILHSQGGIQGTMIIDWLLADVPRETLKRLEVYTFGNAANHFNDPVLQRTDNSASFMSSLSKESEEDVDKILGRVEHYAHSGDFVSRWGVLHFVNASEYTGNRFIGRVFEQSASGHQFNQHYLDNMFPLDPVTKRVKETNPFMDSAVDIDGDLVLARETRATSTSRAPTSTSMGAGAEKPTTENGNGNGNGNAVSSTTTKRNKKDQKKAESTATEDYAQIFGLALRRHTDSFRSRKVKELSRLWQYRNGRTPA